MNEGTDLAGQAIDPPDQDPEGVVRTSDFGVSSDVEPPRLAGLFSRLPQAEEPLSLPSRLVGERVAAAIFLGIALTALIISVTSYGLYNKGQPAPGLFPAVVSSALALLSLMWLVKGRPGQPGNGSALTDEEEEDGVERTTRAGAAIRVFAVIWFLVPILGLEQFGFVPAMTVYVGVMLIVITRMRWWIALPATLVVCVLVGIGADKIGIQLPDPFGLLRPFGV
ncbi:MAG: tripartite tricarboxylate transporter TctB family protein [Propionibacteriaceae bacterium]|nr:tripartite tricarboxylate transporter TctB family protein [Propionibacteriaceae bacterium]